LRSAASGVARMRPSAPRSGTRAAVAPAP
jgi:hypothetical protein